MLSTLGRLTVVIALAAGFLAAQTASKPLDNDGVIKLVRAGMSEEVVAAAVKSAGEVRFDTSPEGLLALKKAGVPDRVLLAILERQRTAPVTPAAPAVTPPVGKVTLLAGEKDVELTSSQVMLAYAPKDARFSETVKQAGTRLDADADPDKGPVEGSRRSGFGRVLRKLPVTMTAGGSDVVRPPSAGPADPRNLRVRQFFFIEERPVPEVSGTVMLRMPAVYGGIDLDEYTPVLMKLTVCEKEQARLIETRDVETRQAALNPEQREPEMKILSAVRAEFPVAGRRDGSVVSVTTGDLQPGFYAFLLRDSTGDSYAPYAFEFRLR
ncbi:MAG: hypothetical protein ABFD86_21925 [Bryobacteraceae bacterium]